MTVPTLPLTPPPRPAPAARSRVPSPAVAVLAAGCAAGGVWLLQAVAVGTASGQRVDEAAMRAAGGAPGSLVHLTAAFLDQVTPVSVGLVLAALSLVAVLRRVLRAGLAAVGVLVGAEATTQLLKATLVRPDLGLGTGGSLPSGHVTLVASLAVAAGLVVAPRWRGAVAVAGAAAVASAAVAVLVQQWHRPSDVLAALLVVAGWAVVVRSCCGSTAATPSCSRPHPAAAERAGGESWRTARAPRSAGAGGRATPPGRSPRCTPRR